MEKERKGIERESKLMEEEDRQAYLYNEELKKQLVNQLINKEKEDETIKSINKENNFLSQLNMSEYQLPVGLRRGDRRLEGDIDALTKTIGHNRTRTKKAPLHSAEQRLGFINTLAPLVSSRAGQDIRRDRKMSNAVGAQNYIDSRAAAIAAKNVNREKEGLAPLKNTWAEMKAQTEDLDDDGVDEHTVRGADKNLMWVNGYRTGDRNQDMFDVYNSYYQTYPSIDDRKQTPSSTYFRTLRKAVGSETFMDLWGEVFTNYLSTNGALQNTSKMIINRIKMALYRLFMVALLRRAVGVNDEDGDVAYGKIQKALKSKAVKDEMLTRASNYIYNPTSYGEFSEAFFPRFDDKARDLIPKLRREFAEGKLAVGPDGKLLNGALVSPTSPMDVENSQYQ
jgi:hypothetical protein